MKPTPSSLSQRIIPNSTIIPFFFFVLLCALLLSVGEATSLFTNAEPVAEPIPALFHPVHNGESSTPAASNIALALSGSAQRQLLAEEERAQAAAHRAKPAGFEDLQLLDIVLVTTADGGMHAIERSTGRKIWSQPGMIRSERGPGVVKNRYNESSGEAWYMLDPHDGQLYVYTDVDAKAGGLSGKGMQKLPLKLEELIDLSPFTFPQSPSHVFIGSKSTSLLGIDLQTGESVGSFGTGKASSLGVCKPTGDGLQEIDEDECESDIDDRPEDLLYLGQTDHHLVVRSHTGTIIQDLHHIRVVPNAAHRDVADYWFKNGNVKGDVPIRRKYGSYTGSFGAHAQVEYEDRWRVEVLFDGQIAGVRQEEGLKWITNLGSVAVSVFDVLRPEAPGSKPILLPQSPAYLPTLMLEPQQNLQLMSLSPSAYVHEIPIGAENSNGDIDNDLQSQGFFIMSSSNHPFVGYAPRAQDGALLGGHEIQEAVSERLPPLIDPAPDLNEADRGSTHEPIVSNETQIEGSETTGVDTTGWKRVSSRWMVASVVGGIALALLLGIVILYRRRKTAGTGSNGTADNISADRKTPKSLPIAVDKDLPDIPPEEIERDVKDERTVVRNESSSSIENIDVVATPKKSNGRRRKRGKKNRGKRDDAGNDEENEDGDSEVEASQNDTAKGDMLVAPPSEVEQPEDIMKDHDVTQIDSLSVTDSVIGFGSHGTVVYKGVFQGRAVAVKRLLRDFVSIASQEVALLQASDDHQNVIRYFYQEKRDNFLYIALELCSASLADIVENPSAHQDLVVGFDRKKSIYQITSGLRHLHGLKIIHRDLKPQNVLVSVNNKGVQRMLLSDFGLAKRLDHGQSSYAQTANHAVGSIGWRAPECLRGEVSLDDLFEDSSQSSLGNHLNGSSSRFSGNGSSTGRHARLTKAVDLFSLGCMYFYVMTGGCHPFGDRYEREINIVRGNIIGLDKLDSYGEDGYEAKTLIERLLSPGSSERPDTSVCMVHPMFWTAARRLAFLCDASDRFEIMELQPPEPTLCQLESCATDVIGQSWQKKLDSVFLDNLGKHRKYDSRSLRDLLRALRNKKHHYQDLPDNVKRRLGSLPAGFLNYFTSRFPTLFTHVHSVVQGSKLRHESMFAAYFEQED